MIFSYFYEICEQLVEDSSEIASARVSSSYRKSIKRTIFTNKPGPIKKHSLSKISEENSDSEELRLKHKDNCCHVTLVCDDEKVTSDTSNTSNNHSSDKDRVSHERENEMLEPLTFVIDGTMCDKSDNSDKGESDKCQVIDKKKSRKNKTAENVKQSFLLSRFVSECNDNNKMTIV